MGDPLKENDIIGTVRSNETPITSPFLIKGSEAWGRTVVFRPPKQ